MHFVAALDRIPGMRCVLACRRTSSTGAADGYYRITGKPAATLLHCGPGLANGLVEPAQRAPRAIRHRQHRRRPGDLSPPARCAAHRRRRGLGAAGVDVGAHRASADQVGGDAAAAVQAARSAPGSIATLILPSDASWNEGGVIGTPLPVPVAPPADPHRVRNAARVLREKKNVLLLLGGEAVHERSQQLAWRIAAMTGAKLMTELSNARTERGRGRLPLERVPYPTMPR